MKQIQVVAAIIHDEEGKVLATQRGYGEYEGWWEFPGGKMEQGETREVALVREIWEELCVMIVPEVWLCTVEHDYPTFHLTMHCALCYIAQGTVQLSEHLSARWLKLDELNTVQWLPADVQVVERLRTWDEVLKEGKESSNR
ncbi:MAG: (deoxy)nucleoside triphosphate pyrophosphohydrolase [Bacteroidaceae bacterium]|nr:(deoxy)nucleoside triphosphate pyrophosphohydrolase [Bacteroidaceae bacterium]